MGLDRDEMLCYSGGMNDWKTASVATSREGPVVKALRDVYREAALGPLEREDLEPLREDESLWTGLARLGRIYAGDVVRAVDAPMAAYRGEIAAGPVKELKAPTATEAGMYEVPDLFRAFETAGFGLVGGAPGGPSMSAPAGMIRRPRSVRKLARQLLRQENKARGPAAEEDVIDAVLRSTWFHGRRTLPTSKGQKYFTDPLRMKGARGKGLNVGEPAGLSLTVSPQKAGMFANVRHPAQSAMEKAKLRWENIHSQARRLLDKEAQPDPAAQTKLVLDSKAQYEQGLITKREFDQALDTAFDPKKWLVRAGKARYALREKLEEISDPMIARVRPLFGGKPREKVLTTWEPEHQKVLWDAYKESVRDLEGFEGSGIDPQAARKKTWKQRVEEAMLDYEIKQDFDEQPSARKVFSHLISQNLRARGFRGLLYGPQRYGELELKMFSPEDVAFLDKRAPKSKALKSFFSDAPSGGSGQPIESYVENLVAKAPKRRAQLRGWAREAEETPNLKTLYKRVDRPEGEPAPIDEDAWLNELVKTIVDDLGLVD